MVDYHIHSSLSFDSISDPESMALEAVKRGLREICFTDHYDSNSDPQKPANLFTAEQYRHRYDNLCVPGLVIRRGMEFGLTRLNMGQVQAFEYPFDFVIGSVHFVEGFDPYEPEYWEGRSVQEAFCAYLEEVYQCVRLHDDFDVLGHMTYVCKSIHNPTHEPVRFEEYRDIADEIMKILIAKGKGIEVNTSGIDRVGVFLPSEDYLRRFKELGGQIVTVGSDSHDCSRIGQYIPQALEVIKEIFGYVCTFENRKPMFYKL